MKVHSKIFVIFLHTSEPCLLIFTQDILSWSDMRKENYFHEKHFSLTHLDKAVFQGQSQKSCCFLSCITVVVCQRKLKKKKKTLES